MTKKRVAVFYISASPASDRQVIGLPDGRNVYIRAELAGAGFDEGEALDQAVPRPDESVMNSHEV